MKDFQEYRREVKKLRHPKSRLELHECALLFLIDKEKAKKLYNHSSSEQNDVNKQMMERVETQRINNNQLMVPVPPNNLTREN